MNARRRHTVRQRAGHRCEYCHLPQSGHEERFSVDHVIARKHRGRDALTNLALSCLRCNLHKGTDLSGIDPVSRRIVTLFNPRKQAWEEHFRWNGPIVVGRTPAGRATVAVLAMNARERVRLRQVLMMTGVRFD
jgi:hypothetical protein